jgi:uridine kinase
MLALKPKQESAAIRELVHRCNELPLHQSIYGDDHVQVLDERVGAWRRLMKTHRNDPIGFEMSPFEVWSFPMVLAQFIFASPYKTIGISGAPGSGKSTLARAIKECMLAFQPGNKCLVFSLDDFYLSKSDRLSKGLEFRAQPGSHNLAQAERVLAEFLAGETTIEMPRFDSRTDDTSTSQQLDGPFSKMLLEGMFIGLHSNGYCRISDQIQFLIFLECPISLAKRRRFERESRMKGQLDSEGGFTAAQMTRFWAEVLEPGTRSLVNPIKSNADLTIHLDSNGWVTESYYR